MLRHSLLSPKILTISGALKHSSLLAWLQSPTNSRARPAAPQPVKGDSSTKAKRKASSDNAEQNRANKATTEQALEDEASRDLGQTGTRSEGAPDARPAEGVDDEVVSDSTGSSSGIAADPIPEEAVAEDQDGSEARETVVHEEL